MERQYHSKGLLRCPLFGYWPRRCLLTYVKCLSLLLLWSISACTSVQPSGYLGKGKLAALPKSVDLVEVPFFEQERNHCGPSSLASVLAFWGSDMRLEQIADLVFTPGRRGSLRADMISAPRRLGYLSFSLEGGLEAGLREIQAGNPVIILQNLGLTWLPIWHYAVLVGYDLNTEEVLLRSGRESRLSMSFATLANTWARSDYWAVVVVPADRIPATATANSFLQAVLGLEHAGSLESARTAYEHGLKRWPNDTGMIVGYSNNLYATGQADEAKRVLLQAIDRSPESAVLLNNSAHMLAKEGELDTALELASRAAAIDGPFRDICVRTLETIKQLTVEAK